MTRKQEKTLSKIMDVIECIEYKKNVEFTPFFKQDAYFVKMLVTTSHRDTGEDYVAELDMHLGVKPESQTDEEIMQSIFTGILDFERHEAMEWFKYKGKRVYETHK